jgi:hypothetical protein
MGNKQKTNEERVIREYPNVTYWLDGSRAEGLGNLILTSKRLIFLNRVALEDWQMEKVRELSQDPDLQKILDFSMKLHKKNFEIPLSQVVRARMGILGFLPFPKLCMRIDHMTRRDNFEVTGFWFRIPILKGLVQLEITLVWGWINAVNAALKEGLRAARSATY